MRKSILSVLLAIVVVVCAGAMTASADVTPHSGTWGSLSWSIDANGVLSISGEGEMRDLRDYYDREEEEWTYYAWRNYTYYIHSVIINPGVTNISYNAFKDCSNMTSVTIPDSVVSIDGVAFSNCSSLTSITIPESVTSLGNSVFSNCTNLTGIIIPSNVSTIGYYAFQNCSRLTSVTILGNETSFENAIFTGCSGLESAGPIGSGCNYQFAWTDAIPDYAFSGCSSLTSMTFPAGVTSLGDYAFSGCSSLASLSIPESVTSIGNSAFYNCTGLTNMTIPTGVTVLSSSVFSDCSGLISITIPESVTRIDNYAFARDSSLTSVTIPDGVTDIGSGAYFNCSSLTSVTIPNSVESIGNAAFSGCSALSNVDLSENITSIEANTFKSCTALTEISIPDGVMSIGNNAFNACTNMRNVFLPAELITIGNNAFYSCRSLSQISIPENVTSIGDEAYMNCSGLKSILIPDGVSSIGRSAFRICTNLTSIALPDTLNAISDYLFYGCNKLTGVSLPVNLTSVGYYAFSGCTSLAGVVYPGQLDSIGNYAFNGCSNLADVTFMNGSTRVGNSAFAGCSALADVFFYGTQAQWNVLKQVDGNDPLKNANVHIYRFSISITNLTGHGNVVAVVDGEQVNSTAESETVSLIITPDEGYDLKSVHVFNGMEEVNLENSSFIMPAADVTVEVEFVDHNLISGVWGENIAWSLDTLGTLTVSGTGEMGDFGSESNDAWQAYRDDTITLIIENGITSIGDNAFFGFSNMTGVTIPTSVSVVGDSSFSGCSSLTVFSIPTSVTSIGETAFSDCTGITSLSFPSQMTTIGTFAISGCSALTSVTIPESMTNIGDSAFSECNSLADVYYAGSEEQWSEIIIGSGNSPLINATLHILPLATGRCGADVTWTLERSGLLTISGTGPMYDYGYSSGYDWSGYKASIQSVVVEDGVTSTGKWSFYRCYALESLTVAPSVKTIGYHCFEDCTSLKTVTLPVGVETIDAGAFRFCSSLENLLFPDGLIEIGNDALHNCTGLTYVEIPASVTTVWDQTFSGCTGIKTAGPSGSGCDMEFGWTTSIPVFAFGALPALEEATLPEALTSIPNSAFAYCSSLKSVRLGSGVTSIGDYAFYYCNALSDVYFTGTQTQWNSIAIGENNYCLTNATMHYIPSASGTWGDLQWSLKNSLLTISGVGDMNSFLSGNTTAAWRPYKEYITDLIIEYGVSGISDNSFSGCFYIENVSIPSSVTSIGERAFSSCESLVNLTLPDNVTSIGEQAFSGCRQLTNLNIPTSLVNIGAKAFERSGITSITIPSSVTSIGEAAFSDCSNLSGIWVAEGNTVYSSDSSGALYSIDRSKLLQVPAGLSGAFSIPNWVNSIENYALFGCEGLTGVSIPNSVNRIGNQAFYKCSGLTGLALPNSVTDIGSGAFMDCNGLTSVAIPSGITVIRSSTFSSCYKLTSVTIPVSVTSIESYAFSYCSKLADVYYYSGTQTQWNAISIGSNNQPLQNARLHYHLDSGTWGSLTWSIDSDGLLNIAGNGAMNDFTSSSTEAWRAYKSTITRVTIGSSINSISNYAFSDCTKLTGITIPEGIVSVGGSAFYRCELITSITIPNSVTSIGENAFAYCSSLGGIWVTGGNSAYSSDSNGILYNKNKSVLVQVPCGLTGAVAIPDSVTEIPDRAFFNCRSLTEITIPEHVTSIGKMAFTYCSSLTSFILPESITKIESDTFRNCSSLSSIIIPEGVTSIGICAFLGCEKLNSIVIPDSVISIGESAFEECSGLTEISIPRRITKIEDYTFCNCSSLESITISQDVASIGYEAFYGCNSLTDVFYDGLLEQWNGISVDSDNSPLLEAVLHHKFALFVDSEIFGGSVYVAVNKEPVSIATEGDLIELVVEPDTGYELDMLSVKYGDEEITVSDNSFLMPAGDVTVEATFKKQMFVISWLNDDGSLIDTTVVEYGGVPVHSDPVKDATAEYSYTFAGWEPEITEVTGEAVYTATFTQIKNSYMISWQNEDGSLIDTTVVEYGEVPTHDDAVKDATVEFSYTFAGWYPELSAVTGEAVYTATFATTKNSYTITWINDDGSVIDEITLEYGEIPTHADDFKEATAQYTYSFIGWYPEITAVTGDKTYTAVFDATVNEYTVSFDVDGGTPMPEPQLVAYGGHAVQPDNNPSKTGYSFDGWYLGESAFRFSLTEITGDITLTAKWTANEYTIIWMNDDSTVIGTTTVKHGEVPDHEAPFKQADAQFTYTFEGWDPEPQPATGTALYKAVYRKELNRYAVIWLNDDGSMIDQTIVEYGSIPTHADAEKEATEEYTYIFAGWTPEIKVVTEDASYTAIFTEIRNRFMVSFDANGGINEPEAIEKTAGQDLILPMSIPTRDDWYFLGWAEFAEASSPEYLPGDRYIQDADVTLFAVWAQPDFVLPSGLVQIGEEAFSSGAFRFVKLSNQTSSIGPRAFSDCKNLDTMIIPEATVDIDGQAFDGVTELIIIGARGSRAESFAQENGFGFIAIS